MSLNKPYQDIRGTTIFDHDMARKGYHLNQFCMSLMTNENREKFKADENGYMDNWSLTEEQKRAVIQRDYNQMLSLGGNIYFLAKIFSTDGISYQAAASTMTGMSEKEYREMMLSGGRKPEYLFIPGGDDNGEN